MLKITQFRSTLKIEPASRAGFLLPHLKYTYMHYPNETMTVRDHRTGAPREIQVQSKTPKFVNVDLWQQGPEGEDAIYTHVGLLRRITNLCEKTFGYTVDVERVGPPLPEPRITPAVVEGLYPEQKECFIKMITSQAGGMCKATMGAGKTHVIASLIRAYAHHAKGGKKILVVTRRATVVRRLHKSLPGLLEGFDLSVGIWGKTKRTGDVIVCTDKMLHHFDPDEVVGIIFDEVHRAASESTSVQILAFELARRYGASATIGERRDGKDLLLEAMFGPILFDLTDAEAEALNRVAPLKVYAMSVPEGPEINPNWGTIRRERVGITENDKRNEVVERVARITPEDQQILIFVRTKKHGEELMRRFGEEMGFKLYHGQLSDKVRIEMEGEFESGEHLRWIATDALGEGVDPNELMVVVDANWTESEVDVPQRAGRNRRWGAERLKKSWGILVAFEDQWSETMRRKARARIAIYKKRGYELYRDSRPEHIQFVGQPFRLQE